MNRFDLLEQLFINQIGDAIIFDHFVIIFWLIQSHSQGRTGSPALRHKDPDNRCFFSFLEEFLDFLVRLVGNFKHCDLLWDDFNRGSNYSKIVCI